MVGHALLARTASEVEAGQSAIALSMKQLVSRSRCASAERLNYAADAIFLEPSLFAYFSPQRTRVPLDQVLYGYLPREDRPSPTVVCTGTHSVAHLPGLGWVRTGIGERLVTIVRDEAQGDFRVEAQGRRVPHELVPEQRVLGTHVEIARSNDPLTDVLLTEGANTVAVNEPNASQARALARAFDLIRRASPPLFEILSRVTRRIVLFSDERRPSFASFSAHGAAFLHATTDATAASFVEDLAHQCGHIAFNAMTLRKQELLAVDADLPLRRVNGNPDEARTVYETLHGVFTECLMSIALLGCFELGVLQARARHELLGRLSFIVTRLALDLRNLNGDGLFRAHGRALYAQLRDVHDEVVARAGQTIGGFDLRNQPYVFSYPAFASRNPARC